MKRTLELQEKPSTISANVSRYGEQTDSVDQMAEMRHMFTQMLKNGQESS